MAHTSLAQQLRRLAVPQTSILLRDKKRASLLFDPSEASNLDLQTVLEIGVSGLRELQQVGGPEFAKFENDLFDATSVGVERAVLSKEANDKLDAKIIRFLSLLSPYVLLKPAHRALEWLIQRFHIQEYNRDLLIFLFLPYHETKIFVRVLQIIDLSSPSDPWHWLHPISREGTSLPHSTIVGHASSSNAFLAGLCKHVQLNVKVHKWKASVLSSLIAFYCTTVVGAIEFIKKRRKGGVESARESQLQIILPCLMKGLPSDIPDYACASFIIVSSLARNGFLSLPLLHEIIKKIVKNCSSGNFLTKEVAALLTVICETQSSDEGGIFPSSALKKMLKYDVLVPLIRELASISENVFTAKVSMALLVGLLPLAKESAGNELAPLAQSVLSELLGVLYLDKSYSKQAISLLVTTMANDLKEEKFEEEERDESYSVWLNGLLRSLETKYPVSFDEVVQKLILAKGKEESVTASIFGRLLGISVLNKEEFGGLIERLCHPEKAVRVIALENVASMDITFLKGIEETQSMTWVLEQRLQDDSADVIKVTLGLPILSAVLGRTRLIKQIIKVVERALKCISVGHDKDTWVQVILSSLEILFTHGFEKMVGESSPEGGDFFRERLKVLLTVLPLLCPSSVEEMEMAHKVLNLTCTDPVLSGLWKELAGKKSPEDACHKVFDHLMDFGSCAANDGIQAVDLVDNLCSLGFEEQTEPVTRLMIVLILSGIARSSTLNVKSTILDFAIQVLTHSKIVVAKESKKKVVSHTITGGSFCPCVTSAKKGGFPLQAALHCFASVYSSSSSWLPSSITKDSIWWCPNGSLKEVSDEAVQKMNLAVQIFDVVAFGCSLNKNRKLSPDIFADIQILCLECLKNFFNVHFPKLQDQLRFLSFLWIAHEIPVNAEKFVNGMVVDETTFIIQNEGKEHKLHHTLTKLGLYISPQLQIRSIHLANALISRSPSPTSWVLETSGMGSSIVPTMLVACTSPLMSVRTETIRLLQSLLFTVGARLDLKGSSYLPLVTELLKQSEEIILDPLQLSLILYAQLSPEPAIMAMHSAEKKLQMTNIRTSLFTILRPDSPAPRYMMRALLQILYGIRSVEIVKNLAPLGMSLLEEGQNATLLDEYSTDCLASIINRFDSSVAPFIDSSNEDSQAWTFFKSCLSDTTTEIPVTDDVKQLVPNISDFMRVTCPAVLCLQEITKEFFDALPSQNHRMEVLSLMVDVASQKTINNSSSSKEFPVTEAASVAAKSAMKKLTIDSQLIVEELEKMLSTEEDSGKRKSALRKPSKRVISVLTIKTLQSHSWMRGVVLLEIIQTKKKIKNPHLILPHLFELLKSCLQLKHQEPVEYTKQVILACALHCLRNVGDNDEDGDDEGHKNIDKNQLDVETIVHCIRSTQNPHTHRHALLLLSRAAELIPDSVLHNVMAIFAFVGTSMVRQDDEYSFEVISRTIECIVPVLTKMGKTVKSIPRRKIAGVSLDFLEGPGALGILKVARVFADAVPDVPPHRRLPLYKKLVETVGWDAGLPQLLLLVIEGHVLHGTTKSQDTDGDGINLDSRLELAYEIIRESPPYSIILSILKMLEFVNLLPADKESGKNGKILWHSRQANEVKYTTHTYHNIFDVQNRTGTQLRHFKHAILSFLLEVVSEPQIVAKISLIDENSLEAEGNLQPVDVLFQNLIQKLLSYIATVAGELDNPGANYSSIRYWKAVQQRCHQILEKVNALLPGSLFLAVVRGLLSYQLSSVRRKAADILVSRLLSLINEKGTPAEACASLSEGDRVLLQGILLGPLVDMMQSRESNETEVTVTKENDLNCQVALFTAKLLIRILGSVEKPEVLKKVLSLVTKVASSTLNVGEGIGHTASGVLASAVLCIAEICSVLKVNSLTELHNFMPVLLSSLCSNMKDGVSISAQIGVITAVQRVVESISQFLSPYLKALLVRLCLFAAQQTVDGVEGFSVQNNQLSQRISSILNKIAAAIPLRVLIPAVSDTYSVLLEGKPQQSSKPTPVKESKKHKRRRSSSEGGTAVDESGLEELPNESHRHMAIIPLMGMFSHSLSEVTQEDISSHLSDMERLFQCALDFRVKNRDSENPSIVENVESCVISTLVVLVLKLSETTFRPLFYRLFEWASGENAPPQRAITFYRLSSKCADALKGLFVLFAGHFIRHAAILLDRNNIMKTDASEKKEDIELEGEQEKGVGETADCSPFFEDGDGREAHLLITYILSTLHAVFLYDGTGRFVSRARFETLMPPLVNQLENLVGGVELFQERLDSVVISSVVKLAVAAADDSLWKQLSYQVLLKTRHSNPKVRLAGLAALFELGKQLGEDFLPLLPETVPFLAELMEDEEEEVELAAQKAIAALSDVLGEPLQKYL